MKARNILATQEEAERWIRDGILPERMREDSANTPVSNAAKVTEQQNGPSSGVAL